MHRRSSNRGFVLILALAMLLAMTIAALATATMVASQSTLAAAAANQRMAFESASSAALSAEGALLAGTAALTPGSTGFYPQTLTQPPPWSSPTLWQSQNLLTMPALQTGEPPAAYVIEQLPSVAIPGQGISSNAYGGGSIPVAVYRITAHAVGPDGSHAALVQTVFHP